MIIVTREHRRQQLNAILQSQGMEELLKIYWEALGVPEAHGMLNEVPINIKNRDVIEYILDKEYPESK